MTKYIKTAVIEAEQFDGSSEMIKKYGLKYVPSGPHLDIKLVIPTLEGNMALEKGDWIATGVNGEHWAVAQDIFEKTYAPTTDIKARPKIYVGWSASTTSYNIKFTTYDQLTAKKLLAELVTRAGLPTDTIRHRPSKNIVYDEKNDTTFGYTLVEVQ